MGTCGSAFEDGFLNVVAFAPDRSHDLSGNFFHLIQSSREYLMRMTALLLFASLIAIAQTWQGNHDESKVKSYTLPDPLTLLNGKKVKTANEWTRTRRPEILRLFEQNVYGQTPSAHIKPHYEVASITREALGGKAVRKQITISFAGQENGPKIHMLMYLPANAKGPAPVFLGLNFGGNQTVDTDPGITLHDIWTREQVRKPAAEDSRGRAQVNGR